MKLSQSWEMDEEIAISVEHIAPMLMHVKGAVLPNFAKS
jgi:hypothetical protein